MLIAVVVLSALCLILFVGIWRHRYLLDITYAEGRRAGLKQAIDAAKERGDTAVLVAPTGMLLEGLVRAQTAHRIEMDLRNLLVEVR